MPLVLADTSAWISHQQRFDSHFDALLAAGLMVTHGIVVGELTLGCGSKAKELAATASGLLRVPELDDDAVRTMVVLHALDCKGLSWPDSAILASVLAYPGVRIYTHDRAMGEAAVRLGIGWP